MPLQKQNKFKKCHTYKAWGERTSELTGAGILAVLIYSILSYGRSEISQSSHGGDTSGQSKWDPKSISIIAGPSPAPSI